MDQLGMFFILSQSAWEETLKLFFNSILTPNKVNSIQEAIYQSVKLRLKLKLILKAEAKML